MPITPFLQNQAFDPETVEAMSAELTEVCKTLGLKGRSDQITELVAEHIVELAQQGIRTKTALVMRTMQEFKANPQ